MRVQSWRHPVLEWGFAFPLGFALGIVGTALSVSVGATGWPVVSVVVLVVVTDVVAVVSTAWPTLATAVVCWCLHSGFVLGRAGELAFSAQSWHDALVLMVNAVVASVVVATIRAALSYRRA